ncbi:MAG: hypothetical protein VKL39_11235 [Leptolyngbyaceae bacterium]|nr:hypothetical protein [Leptolyngbyaceae bacterium]
MQHMFGQSPDSNDFLTPEEAAKVDAALLTSRDKFSARVAIYSLRVLKQIAAENQMAIAQVSPDDIIQWVNHDEAVKASSIPGDESAVGAERGDRFQSFFSKLVASSLRPLHQISQETQTSLENVSVTQVIQWFEKGARERIESAE